MRLILPPYFKYFLSHFRLLFIKLGGIISLLLSYKLINIYFGEFVFGTFTLLVVFCQIFMQLASFGIPIYSMKEIAKIVNTKDADDKLQNIQNSSFSAILLNSIILYIFIIIFKKYFAIFFLPEQESYILIILISVSFPLIALNSLNAQILRAYGKVNLFQFILGTLPFLIFFICLLLINIISRIGNNIFLLVLLYIIGHLVTFIFGLIVLKNIRVYYSLVFNIKGLISINKRSFDYFSSQLITQSYNWFTIMLTSIFASPIEVGGMNVITKYLSLTNLMLNVTNNYLGPSFSKLFYTNKIKEMNNLIFKNTNFMVFVTLPVIIILFIFPKYFLGFFSTEYISLSNILRIMLVGTFVNILCGSVGLLMQMTNQQKKFKIILFISLVMHIILGSLLSNLIGILGIGISATFTLIFWNLFSIYILKTKNNIISYFRFKYHIKLFN